MGIFDWFKSPFASAQEIEHYMGQNAKIIDVRSPGEFAGGHPKGAVNIPLSEIPKQLNTLKSTKQPVILVCRSGARAAMAAKQFKNHGIDVINAGRWQAIPQK